MLHIQRLPSTVGTGQSENLIFAVAFMDQPLPVVYSPSYYGHGNEQGKETNHGSLERIITITPCF